MSARLELRDNEVLALAIATWSIVNLGLEERAEWDETLRHNGTSMKALDRALFKLRTHLPKDEQ